MKEEIKQRLREIAKEKIICLDVETTGLDAWDDEILQLSIIDGKGEVLFNEYIKPVGKNDWEDAQEIHGITPEMVAEKKTMAEHLNIINDIIAKAQLIVGYNSNHFDLAFLRNAGVRIPSGIEKYDVMLEFAPIYGEWNDHFGDYKWQKLAVCADYYDYKGDGEFHDSLEDVRATLHCFFAMTDQEFA